MSVSYKKLWKLLIDKDMKKKDLCEKAGISPASVTKMGRNGHVTTEILVKICAALDCGIEDIIEIVPDEKTLLSEDGIKTLNAYALKGYRLITDYPLFDKPTSREEFLDAFNVAMQFYEKKDS